MRVAGLVLVVAGVASAQVHGKDGITLPAAPVVATHPVTDSYGSWPRHDHRDGPVSLARRCEEPGDAGVHHG